MSSYLYELREYNTFPGKEKMEASNNMEIKESSPLNLDGWQQECQVSALAIYHPGRH